MRYDVRHDVLSIVHDGARQHTPTMIDHKFISIRDAAQLAGVSKKTIERVYKKYLKDNGLALETASDIIRLDEQGSRRQFLISETFVRDSVMKGQSASGRPHVASNVDAELIRQLNIKDEQLRAKDEQTSKMDLHVVQLTERLKDAQHSLKVEQTLLIQAQDKRRWPFQLKRGDSHEVMDAPKQGTLIRWNWIAQTATMGVSLLIVIGWVLTFQQS